MLPILTTFVHPLLALLIIALSAWIFGETCLRGRLHADGLERGLIAVVLGLGLITQGLFVLGMFGGLTRTWTVAALLAAHLLCWRRWRSLGQALRGSWRRPPWIAVSFAVVLLLPSFLLAHYPPTGFDATVYHLPYVKAFLSAERLVFVEDLRFPIFPQVGEMGFVLAFLLQGETAAKLTQWLAWLLVAGLVAVWGRQESESERSAGLWAAALWIGVPLALWIGVQAYVDLTLTLFTTAALYAWTRWRATDQNAWIVLCGLFGGFAAGTKYLALFLLLALGILGLADAWQRRRLKPLALLVISATLMMAPWYGRILYHTGNPVFPFYAPLFGASDWTSSHDRALPSAEAASGLDAVAPVARSQFGKMLDGLGFLAMVPWNAVFERQHFRFQAPLTPFYLLLLPLALPLALRDRRSRWTLLGLFLYGLFWLTTVRDLRFLLPVLPLFHRVLITALSPWLNQLGQRLERTRFLSRTVFAWGLTALLALPGWGYAIHKLNERGPIPTTAESRVAYLLENVPGYPAVHTLNQEHGRDYTAYALFGEHLHYHADGRLLGDWFGPGNYWTILAVLHDEDQLHGRLRALGVCSLILVDGPRPVDLPRTASTPRFEFVGSWDDASLYRLAGCPR